LTGVELLAAVIGGNSAIEAAQQLYQLCGGSLHRLAKIPHARLTSVDGIGVAAADRLVAMLEIGRRYATELEATGAPMRCPRDVFEFVQPRMQDLVSRSSTCSSSIRSIALSATFW
jgi:DNA repair protein RadC